MSRIGKNPVVIVPGVTVSVADGIITVKGKLGQLTQEYSDVTVTVEGDQVLVERSSDTKDQRAKHGLYRSLINNMIIGVTEGFTKSLEMEVAKYGVTVNTISPGYIGTDMVMAVPEKVLNQIVAQVPMGRLGGTHEVAHLVSFLASEETSFITGANYSINGGQHVY